MKLSAIGIRANALRWLGNFLIGRKQAVAVDGVLSSCVDVGSGVPQGSILGPLLYLIFDNDFPAARQETDNRNGQKKLYSEL